MLYIAYGSNINQDQMTYRVPGAKPLGKGLISGWKLAFHGTDGSAYATIVKSVDHSVPVVIWEMSDAQEKIMDVYEGYPTSYYKKNIAIVINGVIRMGMVYIMNDSRSVARPSRKYVNTIRKGYQSFGIDEAYLNDALADNSAEFYNDDLDEIRDFRSFKQSAVQAYLIGQTQPKKKKASDRDVVVIPTKQNKDRAPAATYLRKTGSGVTYRSNTKESPSEYNDRMTSYNPYGYY